MSQLEPPQQHVPAIGTGLGTGAGTGRGTGDGVGAGTGDGVGIGPGVGVGPLGHGEPHLFGVGPFTIVPETTIFESLNTDPYKS